MEILYILTGLVILFLGGELLINGSILIAKHLNISKILVSSVIVGFGTSMPEMTVSIEAMIKDTPEIAIGNVIGSNIANILFILGVSAIISPLYLKDDFMKRDLVMMVSATILLVLLSLSGALGFFHGLLMLVILISYITYSYLHDKKYFSNKDIENIESDLKFINNLNLPKSLFISLIGIIMLIFGSSLFLDGSIILGNRLNVSQEVIGLGIIAVGSCLPELAAVIVASYRRHGNIVIASIVGSNIFNILSIVGVISLIKNITMPENILQFDLWLFLATTMILSIMMFLGVKFGRFIGFLFLTSYILYFYNLF